jgi:hypothetical protein
MGARKRTWFRIAVQANDVAAGIDSTIVQRDRRRGRQIDRREVAVVEQKDMVRLVGPGIAAHDLPDSVYLPGIGSDSARNINRGELAPRPHKTMHIPIISRAGHDNGGAETSHDVAIAVNPERVREQGARGIYRREYMPAEQESMPDPGRICWKAIGAHDLAPGVYPCCDSEDRARKINRHELPPRGPQKTVGVTVRGTYVPSDNIPGRVDIHGKSGRRIGNVNRGETPFVGISSSLYVDAQHKAKTKEEQSQLPLHFHPLVQKLTDISVFGRA